MSILPSRVMESAILTLLVVGVELAQKSPTLKRIGQNSRFYKPSSVSEAKAPQFIIYLRRQSPAVSSGLPLGIGRATLNCRYT